MHRLLCDSACCRRMGGKMALCSGPPTQMVASGEITHSVIILETPREPEQESRRACKPSAK